MTPSKRAKQLGCESLSQVARDSGISKRTLINWFKSRPFVFDAICEKVASDKFNNDIEAISCWTCQVE